MTGYTGFSGDPEEQEGNYLALHFEDDNATSISVQVVGSDHAPVTLDEDGILVARIKNIGQDLEFCATTETGAQRIRYDLSGLTLTP